GVATQREELRQRFPGEPQHVINYMTFIAQELREIMAELGFSTLEEMIGRADLLSQREDVEHPKAKKLDLSVITEPPSGEDDRIKTREQNHDIDEQLDWDLLEEIGDAIETGEPVAIDSEITNVDRAVGATISNRISSEYGTEGLPDDTVHVDFDGTAGQSFGAFAQDGLTMELTGTGNDYVGKGLSGGKLIVHTPEEAPYEPTENVLIGNVALYGATQGVAYVYDPDDEFESKANTGMVTLSETLEESDRRMLRRLLENHVAYTDSARAKALLDDWEATLDQFVRVMPDAYAEIIETREGDDVRTELPEPVAPDTESASTDFPASSDD
ncbi:MAG: glutamate synthase-related protein, partial [Halapricum sp.]